MSLCKKCRAYTNRPKDDLMYKPLDEADNLLTHPCIARDKQRVTKANRYKQARDIEKKVERDIAKGTARSGALNGDGDLSVFNGELRIEVKDRGLRKSWNLSLDELNKGRRQNIDVYAINTHTEEYGDKTIYMMEDTIFHHLLAIFKEHTTRE